jgi:hypothetical protein
MSLFSISSIQQNVNNDTQKGYLNYQPNQPISNFKDGMMRRSLRPTGVGLTPVGWEKDVFEQVIGISEVIQEIHNYRPATHIMIPTTTGKNNNNQPPKATRHPGVVLVMNPLPVLPVKSPISSLYQIQAIGRTRKPIICNRLFPPPPRYAPIR